MLSWECCFAVKKLSKNNDVVNKCGSVDVVGEMVYAAHQLFPAAILDFGPISQCAHPRHR